jgi:retron-type reverse transcriptase
MKSPKFKFSIDDILECISPPVISDVWKHKVGAQLRKQVAIDLCEFRDYRERLPTIATDIVESVRSGEYQTHRTRHYLVEKSRGLCRQMTIAAPRDLIILQCLSNRVYTQLRDSQPTTSAYFEPGDGQFNAHSALIRPNTYGSAASWRKFQRAIFEFSQEYRFVVVTDVANFYDFISFDHLRTLVSSS